MRRQPQDLVIACTLEAGAVPDRLAEWRAVLDGARARSDTGDGSIRLELGPEVDLAELTRLVVAEQRCCAFFSFAITADDRGVGLEVRAPDTARDVLMSLFGSSG